VGGDIDFEMLAREFSIAGGSIKNVVLNAAFLAAAAGQSVETRHLVASTRREYEKLGKLWTDPRHEVSA
jgi:hypothetical protein